MFGSRTILAFVCASAFLLAGVSNAELKPRTIPARPENVKINAEAAVYNVVVKFTDESGVRLSDERLRGSSGVDLSSAVTLLDPYLGTQFRSLFSEIGPDRLDRHKRELEQATRRELADLNTYYLVELTDRAEAESLINRLNKLDFIELAYYMPQPEPAGDIPPPTPDYESDQTYRDPDPYGLDFEYANSVAGGDGEGVRVVDIEGNWNQYHEDIERALGGHIAGVFVDDSHWENHGTAVLGVISGGHNGYGISGGSPAAEIGMVAVGSMATAEAIIIAAEALEPGDVILIELHTPGPHYNFQPRSDQAGYVCMEYFQAEFDAILYAWAMGVVVVEAAGNGGEDYDFEPLYGQLFDTTYRNSHAIMVGAGSAGGYGRQKMSFSNYGWRVNVQAYGEGVYTTGYGTLFNGDGDKNQYYTAGFNGTSSASAIIASAAASFQGYYKYTSGIPAFSDLMRDIFVSTGSPQLGDTSMHIGPRPNLQAAFNSVVQPGVVVSLPVIDMTLKEGENAQIPVWFYNRTASQDVEFTISAVDSMYDGTKSPPDWLSVSPSSGTVSSLDSIRLDVTLDAAELTPANDKYQGYLEISWGYSGGPSDSTLVVQALLRVTCASAVLCGDASGNNYVSTADIDFIMDFLSARGQAPECPLNADCDGREGITIADVVHLKRYLDGVGGPLDCGAGSQYGYTVSSSDTVFLPQLSNIPEDIDTLSINLVTSFDPNTRGFFFPAVTRAEGSDDAFYFSGTTCTHSGIDFSFNLHDGISLFYGYETSETEFDNQQILFTLNYERWRDGAGAINTDIDDFSSEQLYAIERDGQLYRPTVVYQNLGSSFLYLSIYELDFMGGPGSPPIEPVAVLVSSTAEPLNWEAEVSESWIVLDVYSGTTDQTVMVSADPSGLEPGYHVGTIAFYVQDGSSQLAREMQIGFSVTTDTYNALRVPEDYSIIQTAIDAAGYWDSVVVGPGTYLEALDFRGKPIKLVSRAGAESTFVSDPDSGSTDWYTVHMTEIHSKGAEFRGFTVYGTPLPHDQTEFWTRGGCLVENCDSVTIVDNIFHNLMDTEPGYLLLAGAHYFKKSHVALLGNVMYDFRSLIAILPDISSTCNIKNNTFNNVIEVILFSPPSGFEFLNNNVTTMISYETTGAFFGRMADYDWETGSKIRIERVEDFDPAELIEIFGPADMADVKDAIIDCNNFWDQFGSMDLYGPNDISVDPLYCCPEGKVFYVQENSPCLPDVSPCGELIGALGYDAAECKCPLKGIPPYAEDITVHPEDNIGAIGSLEPEICWSFFDTLTGAVQNSYEIQVGTDNDWMAAENWEEGPVSSSDTCVIYGGTPLLDHTEYFFRLRLHNGIDWGSWLEGKFLTHVSLTIRIPEEYTTIQEGMNVALTGDTVLVGPGTYYETVFFPENSVILKSSHGPDSTTIVGAGTYAAVAMDHGEYGRFSEVSGFTITGGRMGGVTGNFEFLRISHNVITGNNTDNYSSSSSGGAIYITHATSRIEVVGNVIYGNVNSNAGGSSIRLVYPKDEALIEDNVLYNETADVGIGVDISYNCKIYNNTVYQCGGKGIAALMAGSFDIRNNIVHTTDDYGVWKDLSGYISEFQAEYNCIYNMPDSANFDLSSSNIFEDPLLRDPAADDFGLSAASPCIDAGDPDTAFNDIDGTRSDMGAIRFIHDVPFAANINYGAQAYRDVVREMVPQFNWLYADTTENNQYMYQIQVGTDDNWDIVEIWDSGEMVSSDTSVLYSGPALDDHARYYVRVRVHNGIQWGGWNASEFAISVSDFIQDAIDTASSGTTIMVPAGVYFEAIDFKGKPVTVMAAEGPLHTMITADDLSNLVTFQNHEDSQSVLEGFTLRGGLIGVLCESSGPTIRRNIFVGQKTVDWAAISLGGPGYPPSAVPGPCPAIIVNNTILSCASGGISSISTKAPVIRNNIVAYNEDYGIHSQQYTTHPDNDYNDVYFNGRNTSNFAGQCEKGTGSFESDPILNEDFTLRGDSPCIDAGDPNPLYNDFDGSRNDIGAISYSCGLMVPFAIHINYGEESNGSLVFTLTPQICWSFYDSPPSAPQGYHIRIDDESDFSEPLLWDSGEVLSSDTSVLYAGAPLANGHHYHLSIRVFNGENWGDTRYSSFRILLSDSELQRAIAGVLSGDTVWVEEGIYWGSIDFMGKDIVLKSRSGPQSTIITAPDSEYVVVFENGESEQAVLEGFTIQGGWIGILCINSAPTIRRNILVGQQADDWAAICLAGPGYPPSATPGPAPARIINNTIINAANGGISSFSTETPVIRNNIIVLCPSYGIHVPSSAVAPDVDYNCFYGVDKVCYGNVTVGAGCIFADPMLDSTYGLNQNSPCIDAGDPDTICNDPDGTRNDMGAVPRLPAGPYAVNINYGNNLPGHYVDTVVPTIYWSYRDYTSTVQSAYHIQVSDDTQWGVDDQWDTGEITAVDTSVVYGGTELVSLVKYFMRIRLSNESGWGDWIDDFFIVMDEVMCGDINGDFEINILDVTYMINYLYKEGPEPFSLESADVNSDGNLNILDVTYLVNYLYRDGPDPDCP